MKVLTSKKAIIVMLSLGSVVLAGTIKDINSRTVSRVRALEELAPAERNLASDESVEQPGVAVQRVDMNQSSRINGQWEIMRIVGSDGVVTLDKNNNPEDQKKASKIQMKLVNTSVVRLNGDRGLEYNISLLTEFGTIAIFKHMGNGYEILELRKVQTKSEQVEVANGEIELVLERALNQSKSPKVLTGSEIEGSMTLTKTSIEGLSAQITNANGEVQSIEIASAQLMDGGSFKADVDGDEVAGVVFNNGKDGYRLSFVTGPLAGAMLNFVTSEALAQIETKNDENNDSYFEKEEAEVQAVAQAEVLEERRDVASDVENMEPVRILSADEVRETAETQGFSF